MLTQRAKYAAQRGRFVQKRVLPLPRSPPRDSLKVTVRNVTVIGSLENKVADSLNQPYRQFHRHNCVYFKCITPISIIKNRAQRNIFEEIHGLIYLRCGPAVQK